MKRQKIKGTGHKQPADINTEPNFYAMPPIVASPPFSVTTGASAAEATASSAAKASLFEQASPHLQQYQQQHEQEQQRRAYHSHGFLDDSNIDDSNNTGSSSNASSQPQIHEHELQQQRILQRQLAVSAAAAAIAAESGLTPSRDLSLPSYSALPAPAAATNATGRALTINTATSSEEEERPTGTSGETVDNEHTAHASSSSVTASPGLRSLQGAAHLLQGLTQARLSNSRTPILSSSNSLGEAAPTPFSIPPAVDVASIYPRHQLNDDSGSGSQSTEENGDEGNHQRDHGYKNVDQQSQNEAAGSGGTTRGGPRDWGDFAAV